MRFALLFLAACAVDPATDVDQQDALGGGPTLHLSFTPTATLDTTNIVQGDDASGSIWLAPVGVGPCITVSLSATNLPPGGAVWFRNPSPQVCTGAGAGTDLDIETAPTTPAGTYTVTLVATSGTLHRTTTVTLTVRAASYDVEVWPPAVNLTGGQSATASISLAYDGTYDNVLATRPIALAAFSLPAGVTATFSPAQIEIDTGGVATVTFTAAAGTVLPSTVQIAATGSDGYRKIAPIDVGPHSQLVADGGFEGNGWTLAGDAVILQPVATPIGTFDDAHTGVHAVGFDTGSVSQPIQLGGSPLSAQLSLFVSTSTPGGTTDHLDIRLVSATGEMLLLGRYAPDGAQGCATFNPYFCFPSYQRLDFDVTTAATAFAGRSATLQIVGYSTQTAFTVDDVSLAVGY